MPVADLGELQLHYQDRGSGTPVLGIMGFGIDQRYWAAQIPAITATHRFITFDNRGTGRSSRAVASTIDEMADDAIMLLDHLEIEQTIVFGVSMGGAIAQRIVLDHPDRVAALILAVTWARPIEFMRRQQSVVREVVEHGGPDAILEISMLRMFTPRFFEVGQEVIDRLIRSLNAGGPELIEADAMLGQLDAIEKHDVLADLAGVSCPTLVIGAKKDFMVPDFAAEEIAAVIPGAELAMFETGHGCMIEEMEPFNARLTQFLASLPEG